jgi:hypothetical protein
VKKERKVKKKGNRKVRVRVRVLLELLSLCSTIRNVLML